MKLASVKDKLPCWNCITLPMCYQRVIKESEEFERFLDNPYNISMKSKREVITGVLTAKCSIVKNLIYQSVEIKDGKDGWKLPEGMKRAELLITNENILQSLYEFFTGEKE